MAVVNTTITLNDADAVKVTPASYVQLILYNNNTDSILVGFGDTEPTASHFITVDSAQSKYNTEQVWIKKQPDDSNTVITAIVFT